MNYNKYPLITYSDQMYDALKMRTDQEMVASNSNFIYLLQMPVHVSILKEALAGDTSMICRIANPDQDLLKFIFDYDISQVLYLEEDNVSKDNLKWVLLELGRALRNRSDLSKLSDCKIMDISDFDEMMKSLSVNKQVRACKGIKNASMRDLVKITLYMFKKHAESVFDDTEYLRYVQNMVYDGIPAIFQYAKESVQEKHFVLVTVCKSPAQLQFIKNDSLRAEIINIMHEFYDNWDTVYNQAIHPKDDSDDSY